MRFVASTATLYLALRGAEILNRAWVLPGWAEEAVAAVCASLGAIVAARLGILPKRL